MAGAVLLLLLLLFGWKTLSGCREQTLKRITIVAWALLVILQTGFVLLLHNNIRYDAYWVLNQAIEMLDTHQISPTLYNEYFTQVPNNYGITLITYWFLSLAKFLGCPESFYMRAVQLFNTAFIDVSLLCVFLSIRKLKGKAPAVFFLVFCLLNPFSYVWTVYYYTSTTSMAFACAAIYIWLCIRDASSRKKAWFLAGLLGILCITGFKVRATSLIAYIAIFLFWSLSAKKEGLKKHAPAIIIFCLTAVISFVGWKGIVSHYVPFDTTDTAFPVTHFMMMGSRWDGGYNNDDRLYTISLPTAEAKVEGTIAVIKERLAENGFWGTIEVLLAKQLNCWQEGTDFAKYEHSLCTDFNVLHTYLVGSKNGYYVAYAQMIRVLQLFLVCISCIFALCRKKADGIFLIALNLLGGMAFHLIWETSPAYSIPFTFFSYALVCDGAEQIVTCKYFKRKAAAYTVFGTSAGLLVVTILALVLNFGTYTTEVQLVDDYVANQHMSDDESTTPVIKTGETWRQTFESEVPFNVWHIYFHNPQVVDNTSVYQITLSDENGTVFYNEPLYGYNTGYETFYEIGTDLVVPEGRTRYYIDITALEQDETYYVRFNCLSESLTDVYPYGTMTIDGEETDHDLAFRILHRHVAPLATKKEYCALAILLIALELFLVFRSLRLVKSSRFVH